MSPRGGDVLLAGDKLPVAPNGKEEPAKAGVSRLFSGQKGAGFWPGKAGSFPARKKPAYAGLSRLLPVAPKGKEPASLAGKAGSFRPESRLFWPEKSRLSPAFAGFPSVAPKEPALAGVSRLLFWPKEGAGVSRR